MNSYLVCYDLSNGNSQDYNNLHEKLKSFGKWGRITESTWLIVSNQSATYIRDILINEIDRNSRVFVIKSSGIAAWNNVLCSNDWLKENL